MKNREIFSLALLNLRCNKKTSFSIIIGFWIIAIIILTVLSYSLSMSSYIDNMINKQASNAYLQPMMFSKDKINENYVNNSNIEGLHSTFWYDYKAFLIDKYNTTVSSNFTLDNVVLKENGNEHIGKNDYSYDFNLNKDDIKTRKDTMVLFNVQVMKVEHNLQFASCELKEYKNNFKKSEFITGKELSNDNQIMISDYMLEKFGISKEQQANLIGKKLSFAVKTATGTYEILRDYELIGIIDSDFFRINSRKDTSQIIISSADEKYYNNLQQKLFSYDYHKLIKFYESVDDKTIVPQVKAYELSEIETQQELFSQVTLIAGIVILFAVATFLFLTIYFYYNKRTRYMCMQKAIGLTDVGLFLMMFSELVSLAISSIFLAVPIYFIIIDLLTNTFQTLISKDFVVTISNSIFSICFTFILLLLVVIFFSTTQFLGMRNKSVINN